MNTRLRCVAPAQRIVILQASCASWPEPASFPDLGETSCDLRDWLDRGATHFECRGMGATASRSGLSRPSARFPADEKSGLHFCSTAENAAAVDAFHAAALRSGGHENGAPG